MNVNVGNSLNDMASKFFRKVTGVVYDLQTGKTALKNANGSVTVLDRNEDGFELKNAEFNVTMSVPAFALHTEMDKVKKGDLICSDAGVLGFVIDKGSRDGVVNDAYTVLRPNGAVNTVVVATSTVFGREGIMVVQSFDMGEGGIDPMMLMLMSQGGNIDPMMFMLMGKDKKVDPMMMALMAGGGNIDPMMFLLMGDKDIDPLMLAMVMGGGFGGNNGAAGCAQNGNVWNTGR